MHSCHPCLRLVKCPGILYFIALHFVALQCFCTRQILRVLGFALFSCKLKSLWHSCIEKFHRLHFSNSICSLCVFVSHFDISSNISNFFIIIIFVYGALWSGIFDDTTFTTDVVEIVGELKQKHSLKDVAEFPQSPVKTLKG